MVDLETLVVDRAQADVNRLLELCDKGFALMTADEKSEWLSGMKGAQNIADWNRIESWTAYLAGKLHAYGYTVTVTTRTWTIADFPTRTEIDRIRANIDALQTSFCSLPDWRDIVYNNTLDFNQCNAFEWDLHAIDVWLGRMVTAFMHSGEIYSGEV